MGYMQPPTRSSANQVASSDWNTYVRDNEIEIEARKEIEETPSTGSITISATTAATANVIAQLSAFTPSGTDKYRIEFRASQVTLAANASGNSLIFHLYDGGTNLGRIGVLTNSANTTLDIPVFLAHELTPTNASHTYSIRAHRTNANCTIVHGAGGADVSFPFAVRLIRLP